MNYNEISGAMRDLSRLSFELENLYIENGGEVTDETEAMQAEKDAIINLLTSDGVDDLGRWLKAKEDEEKTLKAERDYIARRIQAVKGTQDFIKKTIGDVLRLTGVDKAKGKNGYSFTPYESVKTGVDKEMLEDLFREKIEKKLRGGKNPVIPQDVTITIGASVKNLPDDSELPNYYIRERIPTCKFTKPRISKPQDNEDNQ